MASAARSRKPGYSLAALLGLAALLRLWGMDARPLWYDEAFAALFAAAGPAAMARGTLTAHAGAAADVHPLLYYTLLWGWERAFGDSVAAVRALSLLFGLGVVALAYRLAKRLFDERFGLLAALLVALSPFQIHYAQEARMYALMAFCLLGATLALWQGMQTRRWGWWLLFGLCAALAQYTHNLSVFYLLPLAATPLLGRDRKALRATALAALFAAVLYLPWLLRLPSQFAKVQQSYWVTRPGPERALTTLMTFVSNLPVPDGWLPLALFAALLLTILGGWQTLRAWRARREGVCRGLWLLYLAFAPPALLWLFSQWQPVYIERALLPSGVLFLLWLGWALTRTGLPRPVMAFAGLLLLGAFALGMVGHLTYRGFPYGPWVALDASLAERASPGDVILHSNKLTFLPMYYYDRDLPQRFLSDPPGSGSDTLAPATQAVLGIRAVDNPAAAVGDASRVWFVIFGRAIEEYQAAGEPVHPHLAWLEVHYRLAGIETWDDVLVYAFERKE